MKHRRNTESGIALIAALALIATAGLMAATMVIISRIGTLYAVSFVDMMRSGYVAEGAANRIRYLIEADRSVFGDSDAQELEYDTYEIDRYLADGSPHEIDYYGTPVKFTISNGVSGYVISGESDFSIYTKNRTDETLVVDTVGVFRRRYTDYEDSDDDVSEDGLEREDYESLGQYNLPRNGSMQYREEMLWIPGSDELLPTDADGRLSAIRHFRITATGNPSIYTATYAQLRTYGELEVEEAVNVLNALKQWRIDRTTLSDQLSEETLSAIKSKFSFTESEYYTVRISQTNADLRPGARLLFTFQADGIGGPSSKVATFLEYFRF